MTRTRLVLSFAAVGLLMSACASGPSGYGSSYGSSYGNPCSAQNAAIGGAGLGTLGAGIGLLAGGTTGAVAGGLIGAGTGAIGGSQVGC